MPDVPVGQPSGGGIAGIPTKWLLIGGGGAALAFLLLRKPSPTSSTPTGSDATYGQALGPNAALALGSLETQTLQQSGVIQEQLQKYFASMGDSISGLSTHLDTQAAILGNQQEELKQGLITGVNEIRGDISGQTAGLTGLLNGYGHTAPTA